MLTLTFRGKSRSRMAARQHEPRCRFLLLSLLAIVLHSTLAASLNLLPALPRLNASNTRPHHYHCNILPSWTGGRPRSATSRFGDCDQAIRMFESEVARNPGPAQWLSLGFPYAVPGYGAPVWTPKRYTSGESPSRPCPPE